MWQTPKTNWVATDPINASDYNRWIGNLNELQTLCQQMYALVETDLGNSKTFSDYPYADMLNNIEIALANINSASYDFDLGVSASFTDNGYYIDYNEINRIESASLKLYTWLMAQFENIPKLSFTLGLYRGLQV